MRKIAAALQAWGPGGAFLLALLDSAGIPFPVGVDALVVLTAATNPGMAYFTAGLSVLGSAIGSMMLFYVARAGGHRYLQKHMETPGALRFRAWFDTYGLVTVLIPTLCPIPLPMKPFVVSAGALGMSPLAFLATVLAGRVPRYLALAALGRNLGMESLSWVAAHKWEFVGGALALGACLMFLARALRADDRATARN